MNPGTSPIDRRTDLPHLVRALHDFDRGERKMVDIATEFGINRRTLSDWWKRNRGKFDALTAPSVEPLAVDTTSDGSPLDDQHADVALLNRRLRRETEAHAQTRQMLGLTRSELETVEARHTEVVSLLEVALSLDLTQRAIPTWMAPGKAAEPHHAVATAILSDLHLDEKVAHHEMSGLNKYDREIALKRLRRWADKHIVLFRDFMGHGVTYDGAVLFLNGDLFSGDIHLELAVTNVDTMFGTLDFWLDPLASVIRQLAAEYGKLVVVVKGGNHGREPWLKRTPAKQRARRNIDWFAGRMLAKMLDGTPGLTWHIEESPQSIIPIYNTRYLVEHGDDLGGGGTGGGIAGIWPGMFRATMKRHQSYASVGQNFDVACYGHWHQAIITPQQGIIMNGSLKGHDEYAVKMGFPFQKAEQVIWQTTPEHGPTLSTTIICEDPAAEGWVRETHVSFEELWGAGSVEDEAA